MPDDAHATNPKRGPLVVTGARGLLGGTLGRLSTPERPIVALGRDDLDITSGDSIARALDRYEPWALINPAAMTDVDGCQRNPEAAWRANAEAPRLLAEACRVRGVHFPHVSPDFVSDGAKRDPYPFEDEPNPLSEYGASKLAGERAAREVLP